MIPVGTLCYMVNCQNPNDDGAVVAIKRLGASARFDCIPSNDSPCHCRSGDTVCSVTNSLDEWCIGDWSNLIPITPPAHDLDTQTPRELVTV